MKLHIYLENNFLIDFSDFDGLLRLQNIFKNIPRNPMGEPRFHIDMARRISTVAEAIDFLLILEKQNRDSVKHIVLDCSAQLAKARTNQL